VEKLSDNTSLDVSNAKDVTEGEYGAKLVVRHDGYVMWLGSGNLYSFSSHKFTHAGQTGRYGPTLSQVHSAYASSAPWASQFVTMTTQGIQEWVVPANGIYKIEAAGAKSGTSSAGYYSDGARLSGTFNLRAGEVIKILVGQEGVYGSHNSGYNGNGGGGTFVVKNTEPLIVAGGGGGVSNNWTSGGRADGKPSNNGTTNGGRENWSFNSSLASYDDATDTLTITGSITYNSSNGTGGGGLVGDGYPLNSDARGRSFMNGGVGGLGAGEGGFGGGGGRSGTGHNPGCGGGGYNGGDAGIYSLPVYPGVGQGGGSYNSGASPTTLSANRSNGYVTITLVEDPDATNAEVEDGEQATADGKLQGVQETAAGKDHYLARMMDGTVYA
jgi:hypothetical protein